MLRMQLLPGRLLRPRSIPSRSIFSFSSASATFATAVASTLEDVDASHKGLAEVVLKKGKTQVFKDGNPMFYSGAVDRIIGRSPPQTGDIFLVADRSERTIGWGLYNSVSMFCVRLMQSEEEATREPGYALNMEKLLEGRLDAAISIRRIIGLPSDHTNVYHLVNSEGDGLSGLIVDVLGDVAIIASSAASVEKYKQEIEYLVGRIGGVNHVRLRPSIDILKEEGLEIILSGEQYLFSMPWKSKDYIVQKPESQ